MKTTFENFDALPDSAHVRLPVVAGLFACSAATVWRRVKDGHLPKPKKLSERVTAWQVGELRRTLTNFPEVQVKLESCTHVNSATE